MGRAEPAAPPSAVPPARSGPPADVTEVRRARLEAPEEEEDGHEEAPPSVATADRGRWRVIVLALTLTAVVAFALTRGGEPDPRRGPEGKEQARAEPVVPPDPSPPSSATKAPILATCAGDPTTNEPSPPASVVPAATADYLFQDSLASDLGPAPDLVETEGGASVFTVDPRTGTTGLRFAGGRGLALAPTTRVIRSSEYTIEILFRLDFIAGYRKIIDFKNAAADDGLYIQDGCLTFFPRKLKANTSIGPDSYVQVVLTRDAADRVVGYVNGVRQFAFNDTAGRAKVSGSKTLRFFVDDVTTTGEHSSGAVSQIRLFDQPLTPNEVAALACTELAIADATFSCQELQQ
jgi:Concanavalin A-like lectin/glucanases superfamily